MNNGIARLNLERASEAEISHRIHDIHDDLKMKSVVG